MKYKVINFNDFPAWKHHIQFDAYAYMYPRLRVSKASQIKVISILSNFNMDTI